MLLFKVRRIVSPYCGHFIGWRMALCVPNTSGFNGRPLFAGRYLIAESSDMTGYPTTEQMANWILEHHQGERVEVVIDSPRYIQGDESEPQQEDGEASNVPQS